MTIAVTLAAVEQVLLAQHSLQSHWNETLEGGREGRERG